MPPRAGSRLARADKHSRALKADPRSPRSTSSSSMGPGARCDAGPTSCSCSADGNGIVMRPDALCPVAATRAARAAPKPRTRLSVAETLNHKRIAEIGAVYDAVPAPRTPVDILARDDGHKPAPGPVATNKWLTAIIVKDAGTVIKRVFGRQTDATPNTAAPGSCSSTATTTRSNEKSRPARTPRRSAHQGYRLSRDARLLRELDGRANGQTSGLACG